MRTPIRVPRACASALLALSSAIALNAAPTVVNPDHVEYTPHPEAVAYKKQVTGRDVSTWVWNIPIELPLVTHGVIHSASMDRDVGYNIYLPPGYSEHTDTRYPVVYYFHGATGSESSDIQVAQWVDDQIQKGYIGDVIYVFPNAGQFSGYRDRPEDNVMAETLVIKELLPMIDANYRTIASREGRALMGFSMGGGGAARLGLKYADMFCAIVAFAGALDADPNAPQDNAGPGAGPGRGRPVGDDNVYHWSTENQEKIRGKTGLFFIVGSEDRLYARQGPFMEHLHELKIPFNYRVIAGLGHDIWGSMDLCGGEAMRFLASKYTPAQTVKKPAH